TLTAEQKRVVKQDRWLRVLHHWSEADDATAADSGDGPIILQMLAAAGADVRPPPVAAGSQWLVADAKSAAHLQESLAVPDEVFFPEGVRARHGYPAKAAPAPPACANALG